MVIGEIEVFPSEDNKIKDNKINDNEDDSIEE